MILYSCVHISSILQIPSFWKKKSMKNLKLDIFKNVQNESIRKVFFPGNPDFLVSLIHAVKIKKINTRCYDNYFLTKTI